MPGRTFEASDKTVGAILHDFAFALPVYQRAYSWTSQTAEQLLDDLLRAIAPDGEVDELPPYFLGSVVVATADPATPAEIIDGQQRLATLTILLCAAREFVSPTIAAALADRIFQPEDSLRGISRRPRLTVRERDQAFFRRYVQDPQGMANIESLGLDTLTPSQRQLAENAIVFKARLRALPQATCDRLVRYLDTRVHVILVSADDADTAFRIFNTLNDRGQSLTYADKIKAEVLGGLAHHDLDVYSRKWEQEEEDLGEKFESLFSYLRTIYTRATDGGSILEDFRTKVLPSFADGRAFIDDCLVPYSDLLQIVLRSQYGDGSPTDEVNVLLRWLRLIGHTEWIPCALAFLRRPHTNRDKLTAFLRDLERLTAALMLMAVKPSDREARYRGVLREVLADADLTAPTSRLQLTAAECVRTRNALDGDFAGLWVTRKYVLLRLDDAISAGALTHIDPSGISVEHVLPRNPEPNSQWLAAFPDVATRKYWTERLANLVLLTTRINRAASRFEFAEKKRRYFRTPAGVSQSALTTQVLQAREWTPDVLMKRQEKLLNVLVNVWRLTG
jgi:hypothetical protein